MTDKKQSGYQKLKAELEAAKARIEELKAKLATYEGNNLAPEPAQEPAQEETEHNHG